MKRVRRFLHIVRFLFSQGSFSKNIIACSILSICNLIQGLLEGSSYFCFLIGISMLLEDHSVVPSAYFHNFHLGFYGWIILGIVAQVIKATVSFLNALLTSGVMNRIQSAVQIALFQRICFLRYAKACSFRSGELMEVVSYPMTFIASVLSLSYACFSSFAMILAMLGTLLIISWKLTLAMILGGIILVIIQYSLKNITVILTKDIIESTNTVMSKMVEMLANLKLLHLFNLKFFFLAQCQQASKKISANKSKLFLCNQLPSIVSELLGVIFIAFCFLSANFLLSESTYAFLPTLVTFAGISYRLFAKSSGLGASLIGVIQNSVYIDQCCFFLDATKNDLESEQGNIIDTFQHAVTFANVSFNYPGTSRDILHSFSLHISKGETIAIVGESGSGKSTILDLLVGLYVPSKGQITIDGQDLQAYNLGSWREKIGVVSQEPAIFNDTLRNNILFANLHASSMDFERAVNQARVHYFAEHLPEKYETILGERGYKLSGGEKQRLALARALIKMPEILILDEATSHLDSLSEKYIQESIQHLMGSVTIIIVAHRLSSVMHADTIYVLKNGQFVESGSHSQLLVREGVYAEMWHTQFLSTRSGEKMEQESLVCADN